MTRLVYFAWVRERVGRSAEDFQIPPEVCTVGELVALLARRDEGYAAAFAEPAMIRAAVDHIHAGFDTPISGAAEIAFFPPMTGG